MKRIAMVVAVLATLLTGCGGGDGDQSAGGDGEERTVLVDFRHDEFAGAFLQYYPEKVQIRPGDTVQFRQAWTGEPHSVTAGTLVDDFIEIFPKLEQYPSFEAAREAGEPEEVLEQVAESYGKLSSMTDRFDPTAAGAEPCFVEDAEDAPLMRDLETDEVDPDVPCPTKGEEQPAFNGRQALYNSGFIPYTGERGNSFTMPIADDATPGTYQYFCNYHFIFMAGSIEVVEEGEEIPSQSEVSRQAREELDADAERALARVRAAEKLDVGDTITETSEGPEGPVESEVTLPLSGRATDEETPVIINEFFPRKFEAKVGEKVTWTLDGSLHTVSFNVPKYFPIFTVDEKDGEVHWDPRAYESRGFGVEREIPDFGDEYETVDLDVGKWDGKGGFHSSGALVPGDTFSVTFTRAGSYPFACVLHPQMVGTLQVTA